MRMSRTAAAAWLILAWVGCASSAWPASSSAALRGRSARVQERVVRAVDAEAPAAVALLETLVNINSGTFNRPGVERVGKLLEGEFAALGFATRRVSMEAAGRASHLVAERRSRAGQRLLLIGHMDTVFEPASPFQAFRRNGASASGPGVIDDKGGLVVMLSALKALAAAHALDGAAITVFVTADEEMPGAPLEFVRREFVAAARSADATLCFEQAVRIDGTDYASTARRGYTDWRLASEGRASHSSAIFSAAAGDGAIFEMSRVLSRFHDELREPNLTFSAGLALGGAGIRIEGDSVGSVANKSNIVPAEARAVGDIRALTPEQVEHVTLRMREIVAASLPGTKSTIDFVTGYPPMAPTARNAALLARYSAASVALGLPEIHALDPMLRGAGDLAFASPYVATISGLGALGDGSHSDRESVDLASLPVQAKRAAMIIYELTH